MLMLGSLLLYPRHSCWACVFDALDCHVQCVLSDLTSYQHVYLALFLCQPVPQHGRFLHKRCRSELSLNVMHEALKWCGPWRHEQPPRQSSIESLPSSIANG